MDHKMTYAGKRQSPDLESVLSLLVLQLQPQLCCHGRVTGREHMDDVRYPSLGLQKELKCLLSPWENTLNPMDICAYSWILAPCSLERQQIYSGILKTQVIVSVLHQETQISISVL